MNFISYSASFSTVLPLVFFLLFKKNNQEKSLKVIFCYILYCIVNELLGFYLKNDFILFGIFTIIEFTSFCFFYYYALPTRIIKKAVPAIGVAFLIFSCVDFLLISRKNVFDSFAVGVEYILIIVMCVYYLAVQLRGINSLSVYSTFNFWVIITFIIYTSGTFFLYIMTENIIHDKNIMHHKQFAFLYTVINSIFNILKNFLLSLAMLMKFNTENTQLKRNKGWDNLLSRKSKS